MTPGAAVVGKDLAVEGTSNQRTSRGENIVGSLQDDPMTLRVELSTPTDGLVVVAQIDGYVKSDSEKTTGDLPTNQPASNLAVMSGVD